MREQIAARLAQCVREQQLGIQARRCAAAGKPCPAALEQFAHRARVGDALAALGVVARPAGLLHSRIPP